MTTETINIAFLGIDERSRSAYEIFFKGLKHFNCRLTEDYNEAQLCLVDNDSYNIKNAYDELVNDHPDMYVLILSLNEYSCASDKESFLRKPVKRDQLEKMLNHMYQNIIGKPLSGKVEPVPSQHKVATVPVKTEKAVESAATAKATDTGVAEKISQPDREKRVVPIKETSKASAVNAAMLLKSEHEEHFVGDQKDIDLDKPENLEKIYYDPDQLMQSIVDKAIIQSSQEQKIVQLDVLNNTFYFDYEEQRVYSTVGPGIIRPLCLVHHDKNISFTTRANTYRTQLHEIMQKNKNQSAKKTLEKQSWNMESFMWLITLWTSRGRIPRGTDVHQPVCLMQWPNLTRLASIPHSFRIAALLRQQRCSLADVARHLKIEQRYVFAFYSACRAIGLAKMSQRRVDKLFVSEKPEKSKNQTILAKILTRLVSFADKSSMNEIA